MENGKWKIMNLSIRVSYTLPCPFLLFYRPHPPSAPSPNLGEGVHGAVHTITTTPPDLLLGEAAERKYDHPSPPPLS